MPNDHFADFLNSLLIRSLCSLRHDKSVASSKASSPQSVT